MYHQPTLDMLASARLQQPAHRDQPVRERPKYDPKTLCYQHAADEAAFTAWRAPALTKMARGVMVVGAIAALMGAAVDWKELDIHAAEEMTAERFAVALGLLINAAVLKTRFAQAHLTGFLAIGAIAVHLIWLVNVPHVGAHLPSYTGVLPINVMLTFLLSGLMFRRAIWVVAGALVAYSTALLLNHPDPLPSIIYLTIASMFAGFGGYAVERAKRDAWAEAILVAEERRRSDRLLLNVLPACIADRMKQGEGVIADRFEDAAVLFGDIVGFTKMSAEIRPETLVRILDDIFSRFDRIADELELEKIKTIGDCYMLACGLPKQRRQDHARIADAALLMQQEIAKVSAAYGYKLNMRIGLHLGPVVAGVIGESKFVYDLWGDTVNVASRMESTAPVGAVQVTDAVKTRLQDRFDFEDRGEIDLKGKGPMRAWRLSGRKP